MISRAARKPVPVSMISRAARKPVPV